MSRTPRQWAMIRLGAFGQVFPPSIEHVVEEQSSQRMRGDQDEAGEDGPE